MWFLLRRQRRAKDDFDGNFDPARVGGSGGGGTLPQIDVDEDDGVGGRLAAGAEGGGIISPYSYTPSVLPQMSQSSNMPLVGAAGGGAGYYPGPGSGGGSGSASYYPGTSSEGAPGSPVLSAGRSSEGGGGYYPASANPYGSGPPLSAVSGSEHSSGGYGPGVVGAGAAGALGLVGGAAAGHAYNRRSAKEMEALGARVTNPDEARAAYLQHGPAPGQYYNGGGEGSNGNGYANGSGAGSEGLRPAGGSVGSGVVVHQDGGRVMGKGRTPAVEEQEDQLPEIPPTYDSLLPDRPEGRQ